MLTIALEYSLWVQIQDDAPVVFLAVAGPPSSVAALLEGKTFVTVVGCTSVMQVLGSKAHPADRDTWWGIQITGR